MAPLYYVCTYVGAVVTASLWLGNYMGKSKGTRSIIPLALGPYLYPFTISVAIIVITNRKTLYHDNRENIPINNIIVISHRPSIHNCFYALTFFIYCTC